MGVSLVLSNCVSTRCLVLLHGTGPDLRTGCSHAQLVVNVVAVATAAVGAFALQESPLTAVQMLWCASTPFCRITAFGVQ